MKHLNILVLLAILPYCIAAQVGLGINTSNPDRLLEINGADRQEGWHEEQNMAVSDVSHAYSVFDLIGPGAMELLQRGTEIRLDQPSKSAVRRFFGFEVILYRVQSETRFRLHIANAHDHALCEFLTKAANAF